MNTEHLKAKFAAMGARLKVGVPFRWQDTDYAIDIRRDKQGEFFELRVAEAMQKRLDTSVLQVQPKDQHLLLLVRHPKDAGQLDRFLCGHDERHWFVAAVPGGASSVPQAKEALKPAPVLASLATHRVSSRKRDQRKNRAFRRQGEWFFVPVSGLMVDPKLVLRNEPIRRGTGKPHTVEQLYRMGGTTVRVCWKYPNGLTEAEYRKVIQEKPDAVKWPWRVMQRDAQVFARGKVRHSDHATIELPDWHRVLANTETQTRAMANMAFLD